MSTTIATRELDGQPIQNRLLLRLIQKLHGLEKRVYDDKVTMYTAIDVLGDKQLAVITLELVQSVRTNVTVDWTVKESAKATMRILVKRILRKYGYPPDLQEAAATLMLQQAEILASQWAS